MEVFKKIGITLTYRGPNFGLRLRASFLLVKASLLLAYDYLLMSETYVMSFAIKYIVKLG